MVLRAVISLSQLHSAESSGDRCTHTLQEVDTIASQ